MSERLTWDQIEQRYPDEWVLLTDVDADEYINIRSAVVVSHSHDMEELERRAETLRLRENALLHTGNPLKPDIAYAL